VESRSAKPKFARDYIANLEHLMLTESLSEPLQANPASQAEAPQVVSEAPEAESARARLIREAIDEIRPNLRRDGGDCELIEISGNKVMVKLSGACVFCKLSSATLDGIQTKIVEKLGEFVRVVPVMGGVRA
jgi:Fe-S cluster biogenesis protein NfuA